MKKLLSVLAAIVFATPAFAAVQNVKVSGDLDSTYINRQNFNLGLRTTGGVPTGLEDQSTFVTQTRVRIDADLSDNVSTTVGLINERAWDAETGSAGNQDTNVQLYLAYATLREFLYSPLTVSVGRQTFNYGNGLIIGDGGANNVATGNLATVAADLTKRTSYDGIKAVLDYKPLTLDLIYFRNSANGTNTGNLSDSRDNDDVYGINANYQLGDAMNTVVEGYFFARKNDTNFNTNTKGDAIYVPGLRVSTNPIKGLNTQAEVAWQLGSKGTTTAAGGVGADDNIHRSALATQFMASYEVPALEKYKPVVSGSYTYLSGDKNGDIGRPGSPAPASGETYSAWDPMFEAQGSGTIYNTLFDLTNMHIVSVGAQVTPLEDVTAKFTWSGLWSATDYGAQNALAIRQPDRTATLSPTTNADERHLGNEYDVNLDYAYTEDVKLGVSLGWFVPGNAFTAANDSTASQALAHVLVNF